MTLRKILLLPVIASIILLVIYSPEIVNTMNIISSSVRIDALFISLAVGAVLFQLLGHYIRSKKATLLFEPIEKSKTATQLRAFSVGQLFNNLLPLRIGEFIRTAIISQKLNISYLYTFTLIIFERAIDILFVTVLATLVILAVTGGVSTVVLSLLAWLFVVGVIGVAGIFILKRSPKWLLKLTYFVTSIFNKQVKNSLRFKFWSVGYGLSKSLAPNILKKYLLMSTGMWGSYVVSTFLIAIALLTSTEWMGQLIAAFAPYVGIAAPAGPAGLGLFSSGTATLMGTVVEGDLVVFSIVSWALILVPISIIGVLSIYKTAEPIWRKRTRGASDASLANKLIRNEDVSSELEHFLEGYLKGNEPSQIVNRLERKGELSLAKYFRGGSDAITILALRGKKRTVKKIIPIELKDRLKAQFDWLKKYGGGVIVKTSNEKTAEDYYSIDIAYDETSVSMFDYVHEISLDKAQKLLASAWKGLEKSVYEGVSTEVSDPAAIEAYVEKHILGCIDKAGVVDGDIIRATESKKIMINGIEYDNVYEILQKIKRNKTAWNDIATYRSTGVVHGDMILDNLLYSRDTKKVIIIDPAPDGNIVEGPVFDFGKAAQSLYCGYEFLLRDESRVELHGNSISFNESKSLRFSELDLYMRETLAKEYLTDGERKAILFHAGSLFLRRLKHQVHYTPENALKFYAIGVRTLNQFLAQYD